MNSLNCINEWKQSNAIFVFKFIRNDNVPICVNELSIFYCVIFCGVYVVLVYFPLSRRGKLVFN